MSKLVTGSCHAVQETVDSSTGSDKDVQLVRRERKRRNIDQRSREYLRVLALRMLAAVRDMCVMALVAFAYAALTNDAPKISKSPPALPFFPKNSVVKDYFRGELSQAISSARQSDIAFVMFYAPWDSSSQESRNEFELAARYMQKLVAFAAVNCWQPDGECRNQYSKVYSWPVFIAYPTHGRGVQYNGPLTALHMVRFLYSIMEPLQRITGLDLHYLRQQYDAVIVANVDALPGSVDYGIVYTVALRFLERDPFQEVGFAINTQRSSSRKISIYTWNSTVVYLEDDWKSDNIINWILKTIWQVTVWASPKGSKSLQLSRYIQPGPTLILFTPRNPLYESHDYYDLLHEVALEYHYCKNHSTSFGTYLLSLGIHNNRIATYKKMSQPCTTNTVTTNIVRDQIKLERIPNVVTISNVNIWKNNTFCVRPANKQDHCFLRDDGFLEEKFDNSLLKEKEKLQEMYDNVIKKHRIVEKYNIENEYMLESYKNVYRMSILTGFNDPRSPRNLVKSHAQNKCRLRNIAEKFSPIYFSESTIDNNIQPNHDITGFACKTNRSLSIIAMDTLKYHHFAESLNINILNKLHKTAAVIVDEKMETHYVLNGKVNDRTLRDFIYKFYENNLSRALYSTSKDFNHTHIYPIVKGGSEKHFLVKELVSENFLGTVMKKNKAVVVLYHTKQCGFCSGISYKFLGVAKLFSYVTNLEFARIDGELNSLPWEYTMESYPTILFFPDKKKSETRVFPRSTPIDITSLVNFVLTNLAPTLKIHAMWSLCNQSKFDEENRKCISLIRLETLSLIERTLQEWRKASVEHKPFILNKLRTLRTLRTLHLLLAHSNDVDSIQKLMERLHTRKTNRSRS